jgi:hypothetical protein
MQYLAKPNPSAVIAINVPVVFMARYVMILRGSTSLRGELEGVGPENRDFFGPCECHLVHNEVLVRNVIHYVPVLL